MMSLENNNKSAKFETLKPFSVLVFFFALACERIFIKMHSTENRCNNNINIEPENLLFAGMSVHFLPRNFIGWGSEGA